MRPNQDEYELMITDYPNTDRLCVICKPLVSFLNVVMMYGPNFCFMLNNKIFNGLK